MLADVVLVGIALRSGPVIRWTSGGFVVFNGETYEAEHPIYGALAEIESVEEGDGDSLPDWGLKVACPTDEAATDFSQPGNQNSPVTAWFGTVDQESGQLASVPELLFEGELDTFDLQYGNGTLTIDTIVVPVAERLFSRNEGNTLSDARHQAIWPGELGESNASTVLQAVAWGAPNPSTDQRAVRRRNIVGYGGS